MKRLTLVVVPLALGCAPPAPPAAPPAEAPPVAASAVPSPAPPLAGSASPSAPAATPEFPLGPALPLHRFAALVAGQRAQLFQVRGRTILRAGSRFFSLSPGQVRRERALENLLAGWDGAIGGRYPDSLVADRPIRDKKDTWRTIREYVRIARGKATVIGQAEESIADSLSRPAVDIVELPDGRPLVRIEAGGGDGASFEWFEFLPGPKSPVEQRLAGIMASVNTAPIVFLRGDGSVAAARHREDENKIQVFWWPAGGSTPSETELAVSEWQRPMEFEESTRGDLFLRIGNALYRQAGATWKHEDLGVPIQGVRPLPDGSVVFVTERDELLVRDSQGTVRRSTWPVITLEGRELPVRFGPWKCTRESGLWAVATDGMGLYHDRPPREIADLGKPDAGQKAVP